MNANRSTGPRPGSNGLRLLGALALGGTLLLAGCVTPASTVYYDQGYPVGPAPVYAEPYPPAPVWVDPYYVPSYPPTVVVPPRYIPPPVIVSPPPVYIERPPVYRPAPGYRPHPGYRPPGYHAGQPRPSPPPNRWQPGGRPDYGGPQAGRPPRPDGNGVRSSRPPAPGTARPWGGRPESGENSGP